MNLSTLFKKYNCDKGRKHGYYEVYEKEWKKLIQNNV